MRFNAQTPTSFVTGLPMPNFAENICMPVYVVNAYDIHNPELFKNYPPAVRPLLQKHGARVLAMETNAAPLEGAAKTMNAIIEFPDEAAVHRFYDDPEYQAIIHLRHDSTAHTTMIILKQFEKK